MLKTHFEVVSYGSEQAQDSWKREKLIPHKTKFCDDLMLQKGRELDFTSDTDFVTCKKCLRKIQHYAEMRMDIPRIK
jgi:hypothetical protein